MRAASMRTPDYRALTVLIVVYAAASFVHFVHNAEFLAAYPGLPSTWTRSGVYLAWVLMTAIGAGGGMLLWCGRPLLGLPVLAIYAMLGLDSLGHYVAAAPAAHTAAMNWTILSEVGAAALVLIEVARQLVLRVAKRREAASG